MRFHLGRLATLALAGLLLTAFCFTDASAQTRRTKRSRRVTNPVTRTTSPAPAPTPAPPSAEPTIISTADEAAAEPATTSANGRRTSARRNTQPLSEEDSSRQRMDKLSAQVNALNDKLSQMELQQRTLVDLERLSRAEARAEGLRAQLRDVQEKEADMQSRMEQLNYQLQPEVIERSLAITGSTRPEDLREARRRQLQAEKDRTQSQLNLLATSRTRLETAITNAEAEADRIRARVDAANADQAMQTGTTVVPDVTTPPASTNTTTTQPAETDTGEPE
ncbi:MAG: hypothetical protein JOZ52_06040 [Acidobacteria bacterium]|nr:hypothetical protein [Acidobacteriota bacterium]